MKYISTGLLFILQLTLYGQNISGRWYGVLKVQGVSLPVVFNINGTVDSLTATMDSPNQGVNGIPANSIHFKDHILKISVLSAGIQYQGKWNSRDTIIGNFMQANQSFPLNLSKEEKETRRPQDPATPYPYHSEEITFKNRKDGILLAGTLTFPKDGQTHPAVVLINGSGGQDRNGKIFGHRPFLVLADHLTRNGIAVLRFDDRGVGKSQGNVETASSLDFSNDVIAAIAFLKKTATSIPIE